VEASVDAFVHAVAPRHRDCLLVFLPLSNFQQRMMCYAALWYGFDLIVTDPGHLFRALKELRPTILIAPPVVYESFETRFVNLPGWKRWTAQVAGEVLRKVPIRAMRTRLARAVFRQVHQAFGGRMRFMVTGMAPIKRSTLDLFDLMQLPLFETYGLIECGSISLNVPGACRLGSVGRLLPGVKIDFEADGEIIASRQPTIASGYFECADGEEERTFLGQNRIGTGDIGRLDEDGYLYLLGRKKEIIVSENGNKIHPEVLESEIDACPHVTKSVVFRSLNTRALTAVVIPKEPCNAEAKRQIERFVDGIAERHPLMAVRTIVFTDMNFSRENGFLRPNLKLDRSRIARHFDGNIHSEGMQARRA